MQWPLSHIIQNVSGIVFGSFTQLLGKDIPNNDPRLIKQFVERVPANIPCFKTESFGHHALNYPMCIGAVAHLNTQSLVWDYNTQQVTV